MATEYGDEEEEEEQLPSPPSMFCEETVGVEGDYRCVRGRKNSWARRAVYGGLRDEDREEEEMSAEDVVDLYQNLFEHPLLVEEEDY